MQTLLDIFCSNDGDREFAEKIRLWAEALMDSLTGEALPERVSRFAADTANRSERPFQHWLEQTAIDLITDRRL